MGDTERPPDRRGDDGKDRKVFVGGLFFDADEAQLRQDFGKFGDIEDIFLPRDRDTQKPRGSGSSRSPGTATPRTPPPR